VHPYAADAELVRLGDDRIGAVGSGADHDAIDSARDRSEIAVGAVAPTVSVLGFTAKTSYPRSRSRR
jgi:hypothetical protein